MVKHFFSAARRAPMGSSRFLVLAALRPTALVALVASAVASGACAHEFDTTSRAPARLTLGDDLYQMLCDRVAATADPFDLEGRKSRGVCHPDAEGKYADTYEDMPEKLSVMVRHRTRMIDALNAMFPRVEYKTADTDGTNQTSLSDLRDLMKALVPLYDDDTLPESTRTLAAIFQSIHFGVDGAKPQPNESPLDANVRKARAKRGEEMRAALARLGARKGYRPIPTAIGVARPFLAYPKLAEFTDQTIKLLGAGGAAEAEIRKLLEVTQHELATTEIGAARLPTPNYGDRFTGVAAARPKLTSEILRNVLVDAPPLLADLSGPAYGADWSKAYAGDTPDLELPFLVRDPRGYASFAVTPSNAADKDGDGLVDVDKYGRFLANDDKPLAVATPFAFVTATGVQSEKDRDPLGRAVLPDQAPLYKYGNAARTLLHAVLRDTQVLAKPENGALLDLAHGAVFQLGKRLDQTKSYADPDQPGKQIEVKFKGFEIADSPVTDLVYALGRTLQLPNIADYLELSRQLLRDHPAEAARLVGAALKIREIANKPEYKDIDLADDSTLWDEIVGVVAQMSAEPAVMKDVLDAFTDPRVLILPKGMASFAAHKDQLDYNPAADSCWAMGAKADASCPQISDPWFNTTVGGQLKDPATKVDLASPDTEDNRSLFQRFASLIDDSSGVRACNRQGATINTKLGPIPVKLPLFGTYDQCEVLNIPDLANYYLGCIAGGNVEGTSTARCKLPVSDGFVSAMNSILGSGNVDNLLESSSGIDGLKQTPTIEALNRLVMWRNPNKFVSDLTDPMPTKVCPVSAANGTRTCASKDDLLMYRQRGTIFMGEAFDALKGLAPIVTPFVKRRADGKGREQYFIGMIGAMNRHWSQGSNATRCVDGGTPQSNPKFCNKSNARAYEPIMAEAFATDIVPAIHEISKVIKGMTINGKPGTDVMAALVRDLLDPANAKAIKLTNRDGSAATTWNDGKTAVPQVTLYYLFANAINKFDKMWPGATEKERFDNADHQIWRAGRSKLVDQFLAIAQDGGDPAKSSFKNGAIRASAPILMDVLEDRIAEHKAVGDFDTWTTTGLVKSFQESMESPITSAALDLQEKIYADKTARDAIGELLAYLATQAGDEDALASTLTAVQDLLQVVGDEANMVPLYHSFAVAAAPDGALKRTLDLLERTGKVETSAEFAAAHGKRRVLPNIMANAVKPMKGSQVTPIEVLIDVVTDLHRSRPIDEKDDPFAPVDYGTVSLNVDEFLTDKTRGLEQFYAIVKNRNLP